MSKLKEPTRWPNGKRPTKNEVKIEIHSRRMGYFCQTLPFKGGELAGGDIAEALTRIMFAVGLWLAGQIPGEPAEEREGPKDGK
jgi:hypothetical protein